MKIVIIRHGDPDYEKDGLTEKGKIEAELLAKRLQGKQMDYFYVSPLGRAVETSIPTVTAAGKEMVICDWLREFDVPITLEDGTKKGIPWDFLPEAWANQKGYYDREQWMEEYPMKHSEIKERYHYVIHNLDKLLKKHGYERSNNLYLAKNPNKDVLVFFCHFGLESVLLSHLLNIPVMCLWHGTVARTSSITVLNTEERRDGIAYFRMSTFGDVAHLEYANEEPSFSARFCEVYTDDTRHD